LYAIKELFKTVIRCSRTDQLENSESFCRIERHTVCTVLYIMFAACFVC